jgi:hypothetical protein
LFEWLEFLAVQIIGDLGMVFIGRRHNPLLRLSVRQFKRVHRGGTVTREA